MVRPRLMMTDSSNLLIPADGAFQPPAGAGCRVE